MTRKSGTLPASAGLVPGPGCRARRIGDRRRFSAVRKLDQIESKWARNITSWELGAVRQSAELSGHRGLHQRGGLAVQGWTHRVVAIFLLNEASQTRRISARPTRPSSAQLRRRAVADKDVVGGVDTLQRSWPVHQHSAGDHEAIDAQNATDRTGEPRRGRIAGVDQCHQTKSGQQPPPRKPWSAWRKPVGFVSGSVWSSAWCSSVRPPSRRWRSASLFAGSARC